MNRLFLLFAGLVCCVSLTFGQSNEGLWQNIEPSTVPTGGKRLIIPNQYTTYRLNQNTLQTVLATAPIEGSMPLSASPAVLEVPLPTGEMAQFQLVRYELLESGLQAKYPALRAYYGRGLENPAQRIRLDWTEAGFRAVLQTGAGSVFIDPYAQGDKDHYVVYFKSDYPSPEQAFVCGTEASDPLKFEGESNFFSAAGDCGFRTYRMAIACTGEYSNYHGASSAAQSGLVLSEVMTSINRVNDVYEVDFGVRLILIANADDVFYYDPATDPYTNGNASAMLGEVTPDLNANIGAANYDIGHVYGSNSGGVASLRGVCGSNKARGVTGGSPPTNDPFWIDYVAHEVGHQFGGNHTQNNPCNRSGASYEPGSASTVMGYAGICAPNVQGNSDAYFHAINIAEVSSFIVNGNGNGCATNIANPNEAPVVDAGQDYIIPKSTPFVLTATGTDPDANDPLTFCWEQYDNEVGEVMPPDPDNLQGPMFRSLTPTTSPQRYFPSLPTVINNGNDTWQVLSDVARELDFRVTVRDNSTNLIACTAEDDMQISVAAVAGPFLVTAPNTTNQVWYENENKTVSWDVAYTNIAPVNCSNVDILLSYDGGFTYPLVLADEVPNTGTASIVVPALTNGPETSVRIMVRCADNVFYDLSDNNLSILPAETTFTIEAAPAALKLCQGENTSFNLNSNALEGYNGQINLSSTALPNGAVVAFVNNPIMAGQSTEVLITQTATLPVGNYPLTITATDGSINRNISFNLIIEPAAIAVTPNSPADNASNVESAPLFEWEDVAGVISYQLQVSEQSDFSQLVLDTVVGDNYLQMTTSLELSRTYYWRVRTMLPCPGPFSAERTFITGNCLVLISTTPIDISPDGANLVYSSVLATNRSEQINSIAISSLQGTHSYMNDLSFALLSPAGTRFDLIGRQCGSSDDFNLGLNDNAQQAVGDAPCSPLGQGGTFRPVDNLSSLVGTNVQGDWTLEVTDHGDQDGGQLAKWELELCLDFDPLPVVWQNFTAIARNTDIHLTWTTTNEVNNDHFVIERLAANGGNFVPIATQTAQLRASNGASYTFTDIAVRPAVDYFYRIRQVDVDGTSSLSAVRQARIKGQTDDIQLFPNPITDHLYIHLTPASPVVDAYQVIDANGRVVLQQTNGFDPQNGIDCQQLPQGVYALRLFTTTEKTYTHKFVVLP